MAGWFTEVFSFRRGFIYFIGTHFEPYPLRVPEQPHVGVR